MNTKRKANTEIQGARLPVSTIDSRLFFENRLAEAAEHSALLFGGGVECAVLFLAEKPLLQGQCGLRNNLEHRAGGDLQKMGEVLSGNPGASLGNVGGNRNGCPSHLVSESKTLSVGEITGGTINKAGKNDCLLPHLQLFEIEHVNN